MRGRTLLVGAIVVPLLSAAGSDAKTRDPGPTIRELKTIEESVGFHPTGNFAHSDESVTAYYRCYYTGKLKLPESYDKLDLREGTKDGCSLDEKKYDVFFYPIEAVASGHAPVTAALDAATPERLATVVPHEDFHAQVRGLPDRIAEAAATLVGFLTGAEAMEKLHGTTSPSEADLFLRKAAIVNRYYDKLQAVYRSRRKRTLSKAAALDQKQRLIAALHRECTAIHPEPRSFNKCVSAPNNAGLAFDRTYTLYYPLLYRVFESCGKDLKCTAETIENAPKKRDEAETVRYFEQYVAARKFRSQE